MQFESDGLATPAFPRSGASFCLNAALKSGVNVRSNRVDVSWSGWLIVHKYRSKAFETSCWCVGSFLRGIKLKKENFAFASLKKSWSQPQESARLTHRSASSFPRMRKLCEIR